MRIQHCLSAIVAALTLAGPAAAEPEFRLVIEDHRFVPDEHVVPAGQKFRLVIENRDDTEEEFESYDLNREKIIPANGTITLFLGPLEPGEYSFMGELNMASAAGRLVAR